MMPVTVERGWDGKRGAMTWWIDDVMMDEQVRLAERRWAPDMEALNQQYLRMLVFAELVYDTDRNKGNILYTSDWKLWMIDFSRAFRIWGELRAPRNGLAVRSRPARADARTDPRTARGAHGRLLHAGEMDAVLKRRDLLVDHFESLIEQNGEQLVLY